MNGTLEVCPMHRCSFCGLTVPQLAPVPWQVHHSCLMLQLFEHQKCDLRQRCYLCALYIHKSLCLQCCCIVSAVVRFSVDAVRGSLDVWCYTSTSASIGHICAVSEHRRDGLPLLMPGGRLLLAALPNSPLRVRCAVNVNANEDMNTLPND